MTPARYERIRSVLDRRQPDLTVLMDNVHKPHNLSAIARTCDAVGIGEVHGVSASDTFRAWRRGASGAQAWVERIGHRSVTDAANALRARGMRIAAADVGTDSVDYRELDYTQPFALIVGAELDGLTEESRKAADLRLSIPMAGMVESLNVSVAVALILFEARYQRAAAGLYAEPRIPDSTYRRLLFEWGHPQVAAHCRRLGLSYPALNEVGDIIGTFPRGRHPNEPRTSPEQHP